MDLGWVFWFGCRSWVKDGKIRKGSSTGTTPLGNVKDGKIREGSSTGATPILNVKDGKVRKGSSTGTTPIGKVQDFMIKGMERELDAEIVAAYHFLIKKIV